MEGSTPYNSIYEAMNGGAPSRGQFCGENENVVCCAHGAECETALHMQRPADDSREEDEGQYANLVEEKEPKKTKKRKDRDELLDSVKKQLENMEIVNKDRNPNEKKKNKSTSRKVVVEDPMFPIKPIRASKPQKKSDSSKKNKKKERRPKPSEDSGNQKVLLRSPRKNKNQNLAKAVYIGVLPFEEAETAVEEKMDFRLYHRIEGNGTLMNLSEEAKLHLVYRTVHGDYRHYPVKESQTEIGMFYVDYGDPRAETLPSLDELVRFYKKNSRMHKRNTDIGHMKC